MIPKLFPTLVLLLLCSSQLLAAPGDLDPLFGTGGKSLIPVGKLSFDQSRAGALQADGKIVLVGDSVSDGQNSGEVTNLIVMRLNPSGTRDQSFGLAGVVVLRLREPVIAAAVAILPDGKILVGGYITAEQSPPATTFIRTFLIARFLPSGAIDSSFGVGGVIRNPLDPNQNSTFAAFALQPDGKIVATGFSGIVPSVNPHAVMVVRYNANGTLDSSFDTDGKAYVNVNPTGNRGNAVAIQPDGKIVIGGNVRETSGTITDFLLLRLNADGSLDNTFDGDGKLTTKLTTSTSTVTAVVLQSDAKILAVGNSTLPGNRNIAIARYNTNGSLDSSFDQDGIVITDVFEEIATSAAIQPDGKLVVGGQATASAGNMPFDFLASRYNTDGSPDNTFGSGGRTVTTFTTITDRANCLLLQADGRITLVGATNEIIDANIALARYNADGSLDNTFDGDGKITFELENANDRIYDSAVQSDGKIVAIGYAFGGLVTQPAVARYNENGSVDTSFGNQGTVILPPDEDFTDRYADSLAIQSDGKIVFLISGSSYIVARLNADGSVDGSFGTAGIVTVQVGTKGDSPSGLRLQPDGKIVLAGNSVGASSGGPSLVRLNSNGTLDMTFGTGGKVLTTDSSISGGVRSLAIQPDGKLVVSGYDLGDIPNTALFFTSRYNASGSIDTSFGGTGAVFTSIGESAGGSAVEVQNDGKIVVAGSSDQNLAIVRYSSQGVLDPTFDGDGKVLVGPPPGQGLSWNIYDMAIQQNGKIVLGGGENAPYNAFGSSAYVSAIFRFNTNGSPDATFAANGRVISAIGSYDSLFSSINILANGKILAAGHSSNGSNDDFTVVRFRGDSLSNARVPFDFDGDGKTDIGIFRPSGGEWWVNRSGDGQTLALVFGSSTDVIAPADYTGDGKADVAIFRPSSGEWYVLRSDDFSYFALPFGTNGDVPVPADYDADGKADFAVFRPSSSTWFITQSSGAPTRIVPFGSTNDQPVVSDYDGDGKADIGIIRRAASGAEWWISRSTAGVLALQFGASTDKAVQGDYTGDGKTDIAVWRPSTGEWFIIRSEDFSYYALPFGTAGDVVAPGDYDGDGKFDLTVFRPSSATWFISRTTAGTQIVQFGANGDRPLPNAFVP